MDNKMILNFLGRLAENNDREWFAAHKAEFLAVKAASEDLAAALIELVATVEPDARHLRPADCTYRIYRDTRFSPDKSPYKRHIGIFVNPPFGKKSPRFGYYLHLEPGNCFFAAGNVCLESSLFKALRRSVYDEIEEYRSIVEDPEFRLLYTRVGDNLLKTAPKGFPKDWPWIDYLKPREYMASAPLSDNFVESPSFIEKLTPYVMQASRFNRFFNFTIDER